MRALLAGFLLLTLAGCGSPPRPYETAPICLQRGGGGIPFGPCVGKTYTT